MNDREFAAALRDRDAILILSHLRPDGDTLGSGAALCSALRRMGKTAYLFPNPETTARYLPYVAQFFAPANFVPACVVAVDIATPNLFPQGLFRRGRSVHRPPPVERAVCRRYAPARGKVRLRRGGARCDRAADRQRHRAGGKPPVHRRYDGHRLLPVREHERRHSARGGAAAGARRR